MRKNRLAKKYEALDKQIMSAYLEKHTRYNRADVRKLKRDLRRLARV